jgi:hypothetical protein
MIFYPINPNDIAVPFPKQIDTELTKREYFSALAIQGLLSANISFENDAETIAKIAIKQADELIKQLNQPRE